MERDGLFPKRRLLTGKIVAWDEAEIDDWIASRSKEFGPAPSRNFKDIVCQRSGAHRNGK
jgi:hypothetical protein